MAFSSTLLFLGGMAFSYFVLTPLMLRLLMEFGTAHVQANITVNYLFDFILKLAVGTGLMFHSARGRDPDPGADRDPALSLVQVAARDRRDRDPRLGRDAGGRRPLDPRAWPGRSSPSTF